MSHVESHLSRFDRFAGDLLNGSLPYGLSPRRPRSRWQFGYVLTHRDEPGVTVIVRCSSSGGVQAALTLRHMKLARADRVMEEFHLFMHRMNTGECGEALGFAFLDRTDAIERLRFLSHAH